MTKALPAAVNATAASHKHLLIYDHTTHTHSIILIQHVEGKLCVWVPLLIRCNTPIIQQNDTAARHILSAGASDLHSFPLFLSLSHFTTTTYLKTTSILMVCHDYLSTCYDEWHVYHVQTWHLHTQQGLFKCWKHTGTLLRIFHPLIVTEEKSPGLEVRDETSPLLPVWVEHTLCMYAAFTNRQADVHHHTNFAS